ncbi:hypothetical protein [Nibricoccus sp. IMCC34717]|uniref:hypothetical protein n=1 Tax=Nibricoccus sp. IMCC34717 TaxID=3034021 RepID=UPI0038513A6F
MLNPSTTEELPSQPIGQSQVERFRERLKLIEARVQKQSQEEKLNQVRALLREEATQILLPALQDAIVQMTVQVLPDPRLAESIERTSLEMTRMNAQVQDLADVQRKAGESARDATEKLTSTMEAMFAATTEEVTSQQSKAAEELLREQRLLSRKQRVWSLAAAGVSLAMLLLLGTATVVWWRWDQKSKLGAELLELQKQCQTLQQEAQRLAAESRDAAAAKVAAGEDLDRLRAEETTARLKIREAAETIAAVDQARTRAQDDIRRLQEIQEKNRFKLIPGTDGAVFVEVLQGSRPFTYQGKHYMRVQDAP